jgi:hypothetical protein
LLTAFPLTEVDRVVRRTVIAAIVVGVVGSAVAVLIGQPYFAPGLILGLVLAVANHRVFQSSALRFTTPEGVVNRKPFAGSVALRLGVCTAVAIGLLIVAPAVGWGVISGLAIFQALMLLNAIIALFRFQRQQASGTGGADV